MRFRAPAQHVYLECGWGRMTPWPMLEWLMAYPGRLGGCVDIQQVKLCREPLKRCLEFEEFYLYGAFKRMSISFMCWLNSLSVLWWFMDLHAKGDLWRGFRKNLHGCQPRVQGECLYFLERLVKKHCKGGCISSHLCLEYQVTPRRIQL